MTYDDLSLLKDEMLAALRAVRPALLDDWQLANIKTQTKACGSIVTSWDLKLDSLISSILATTRLDIFSEESLPELPVEFPKRYWLVDPLDGTIEFVEGTRDFAINIALIEDDYPIWGMIYHPVEDCCYLTGANGVISLKADNTQIELRAPKTQSFNPLKLTLSSRQYQYLSNSLSFYQNLEVVLVGASLKYVTLLTGQAHLYPRRGKCGQWDTAAGQALLEAFGGGIFDWESQTRLRYSKPSLLNDSFIACSHKDALKTFFQYYSQLKEMTP